MEKGKTPEDWSTNKKRQKDVNARYTAKRNQVYFGYKDHIKVDKDSKLIIDSTITSANVHDSRELENLLI